MSTVPWARGIQHQTLNVRDVIGTRQPVSVLVLEEIQDGVRSESAIQDLDVFVGDQTWVRHSTRSSQHEKFFAEDRHVIAHPGCFTCRVEATYKPGALGCNPGWAMPRVAPLCLDAADRQHRFARDRDHVAPHGKCEQGLGREPQSGGTDECDALVEPNFGKAALDA